MHTAVRLLATHHGSTPPIRALRGMAGTMWKCGCGASNTMRRAWCGMRGIHFSQTRWSQSTTNVRSQSASRKGAGRRGGKGESQKESQKDPMKPFTVNSPEHGRATPWRPSTPSTRAQIFAEQGDQKKEEQAVIPPAETKSKEENQGGTSSDGAGTSADLGSQAEAIRKALGTQMTEEMKKALDQMQQMQEKPKPKLTHSHLSKVDRAQKVAENLRKKILALDEAWEKFKGLVENRVATQKASYMEQRKHLSEQYLQKLGQLKQLQQELQRAASQHSNGETIDVEDEDASFEPNFDADIEVIPSIDDENDEPKPPKRPKTAPGEP